MNIEIILFLIGIVLTGIFGNQLLKIGDNIVEKPEFRNSVIQFLLNTILIGVQIASLYLNYTRLPLDKYSVLMMVLNSVAILFIVTVNLIISTSNRDRKYFNQSLNDQYDVMIGLINKMDYKAEELRKMDLERIELLKSDVERLKRK